MRLRRAGPCVDRVRIAEPDGKVDFVAFERLMVRAVLAVAAAWRIENGTIDFDDCVVNARHTIDPLTFGEHVDRPGATKLPVRLAIALLKNSRGEIDVNVPVSGSLSNPQFSLGGVIWRAILNLLTKAVTSPFALLTGAFSGEQAQELGYVDFGLH
ncbi:hypothetical protein DFQ30_000176 [Apophysomyces sp. BC1015]|nr:hypothetical protein DFQ30_000176 [Apophysomyces sp. BC1015]